MCGIVGYAGHRQALDVVLAGLGRLEYRGYDSAGVAIMADGKLSWAKRAGKLGNLRAALAERPPLAGTVGLGHTRWATHGPPTDPNAHPHTDCGGHLAVVHNGIIENFAALRTEVEDQGHELTSETDTELVAHLIEGQLAAMADVPGTGAPPPGSLATAMRQVCQRLRGAFTLVAVDVRDPGAVVGARRNSPLVVGRGAGENFLASDVAAFIAFTREAVELGQDQVVEVRADSVTVTGFDGKPAKVIDYHVDWDISAAEKAGYEYFMLKEIAEQPHAIADTMLGRVGRDGLLTLDEMRLSDDELRDVDKIIIVACGTAYHAGMIAKYAIEHWAKVPCEVELASECRHRGCRRVHEGLLDPAGRLLTGRALSGPGAVNHVRRRGRCGDGSAAADAGRGGADPAGDGACAHRGQRTGRRALRALPWSACRLPRRHGRRAEAEGTRLHACRGVRGRRAQARADRADRRGPAGRRDCALPGWALSAARQDRVEHPGDQGPWRADDRHRR